jgi:hypothetical protein
MKSIKKKPNRDKRSPLVIASWIAACRGYYLTPEICSSARSIKRRAKSSKLKGAVNSLPISIPQYQYQHSQYQYRQYRQFYQYQYRRYRQYHQYQIWQYRQYWFKTKTQYQYSILSIGFGTCLVTYLLSALPLYDRLFWVSEKFPFFET